MYIVGARFLTPIFALAFLTGLAALLTNRTKVPWVMGLLVLCPFGLGFAAAALQVFSFAGSRHQTYLLPFLAIGFAAAFSWLRRGLAAPLLLLLGAIVAPHWVTHSAPDNNNHILSKDEMATAIAYVRRTVPRGTPLFVDYQTRAVLRYYLARDDPKSDTFFPKTPSEEQLGDYWVVVPLQYVPTFTSGEALEEVTKAAQALNVRPDLPLWVVSSAWLEPSLASRLPAIRGGDVKAFGHISVIETPGAVPDPITINWSSPHQSIDGFGAAAAVNPRLSSKLMDFFYTDRGIHLNIIRVVIWPSLADCEAGLSRGKCVASPHATISKSDLANAQAAVARGALVWAAEWSPPGSMKSNGRFLTGGAFIENAANFANLASLQTSFVTLLARNYGITLYALSPQNEPDVSTYYASCTWTAQQLHDYIPYLAQALSSAGYGSVKIMIAEEGIWGNSYSTTAMNDPAVASKISILAAHEYKGVPATPLSWNNFTTQRIWETEVSDPGAYDGSMTSGLAYATMIHGALTAANVSAWHYWSLSGIMFEDNEGLTDFTGHPAKRAYTLGNFSKFVRPGWTRVDVANNTKLLVSGYKGPDTGAVVVVVNRGPAVADQQFQVGALMGASVVPWITSPKLNLRAQLPVPVSSGSFTTTIPAQSVVTFTSTR